MNELKFNIYSHKILIFPNFFTFLYINIHWCYFGFFLALVTGEYTAHTLYIFCFGETDWELVNWIDFFLEFWRLKQTKKKIILNTHWHIGKTNWNFFKFWLSYFSDLPTWFWSGRWFFFSFIGNFYTLIGFCSGDDRVMVF